MSRLVSPTLQQGIFRQRKHLDHARGRGTRLRGLRDAVALFDVGQRHVAHHVTALPAGRRRPVSRLPVAAVQREHYRLLNNLAPLPRMGSPGVGQEIAGRSAPKIRELPLAAIERDGLRSFVRSVFDNVKGT